MCRFMYAVRGETPMDSAGGRSLIGSDKQECIPVSQIMPTGREAFFVIMFRQDEIAKKRPGASVFQSMIR